MPETYVSFQMKSAPMAGKSWYPSHELHAVRGTGTRHTVKTMERGREGNFLDDELPLPKCHKTPPVRTLHYNLAASGIRTHVHVPMLLTTRGMHSRLRVF